MDDDSVRRPATRGKHVDYKKLSEGNYDEHFGLFDDQDEKSDFSDPSEASYHATRRAGDQVESGQAEVGPKLSEDRDFSFPELPVELALQREVDNNSRMRKELEALQKEEVLLSRRKEADALRGQLAEQRARVTRLRGNIDSFKTERRQISDSKKKSSPCNRDKKTASFGNELLANSDDIDILTLRRNIQLKRKVNKQMHELALTDDTEISEDNNSEESIVLEAGAESLTGNKVRSKKLTKKATKIELSVADSDSQLSYESSESDSDSDSDSKKKKKVKNRVSKPKHLTL